MKQISWNEIRVMCSRVQFFISGQNFVIALREKILAQPNSCGQKDIQHKFPAALKSAVLRLLSTCAPVPGATTVDHTANIVQARFARPETRAAVALAQLSGGPN